MNTQALKTRAMSTIVLRYFPVLGRVQALRHALLDAGIAHEDLQIPLEKWPEHKADTAIAGPFGGLPTLSWDEGFISETLPIATFLAKRLGHYEGLSDIQIAFHESIISNCYVEGICRLGELVWSDLIYPGVDLKASLPMLIGRIVDKMARLSAIAPEGGFWGDAHAKRPVMSDFFAAETLYVLRYVLGSSREAALRPKMPRLFAMEDALRERPSLAAAFASRPQAFTGHPSEAAAVAKLQEADLSAIGL